jgi:hypothetical protein
MFCVLQISSLSAGTASDYASMPLRVAAWVFFEATNALEAKTLKFLDWRGPAKAIKTIKTTSRGADMSQGRAVGKHIFGAIRNVAAHEPIDKGQDGPG